MPQFVFMHIFVYTVDEKNLVQSLLRKPFLAYLPGRKKNEKKLLRQKVRESVSGRGNSRGSGRRELDMPRELLEGARKGVSSSGGEGEADRAGHAGPLEQGM